MTKFRGSLAKLKTAVGRCDLVGKWSKHSKNGFYSFRGETDEILNWWPSTGAIQFQGKNHEKFKKRLARSLGKAPKAAEIIFVADGGGSKVRDELELVLRRLGFRTMSQRELRKWRQDDHSRIGTAHPQRRSFRHSTGDA
jgi:hypothetical protein